MVARVTGHEFTMLMMSMTIGSDDVGSILLPLHSLVGVLWMLEICGGRQLCI